MTITYFLDGFKDCYSNLARNRLKKLPKPRNEFTLNTVFQHYKGITQSDSFNLATVSKSTIETILSSWLVQSIRTFFKGWCKSLASC